MKNTPHVIARNEAISELSESGERISWVKNVFAIWICLVISINTMAQTKDTSKLIVIDDRPVNPPKPFIILDDKIYDGPISDIKVSEILSVQILKDSIAKSLYGIKAANGVIVIKTTKNQRADTIKKKEVVIFIRGDSHNPN